MIKISKSEIIQIRLSAAEKQQIEEMAKDLGLSVSSLVRFLLLNKSTADIKKSI